MQNNNVQNLVFLIQPPKVQKKVTKLGKAPFSYKLMNGQRFISLPKILEKKKFKRFTINFGVTSLQILSSPDSLTIAEMDDVEASLTEIKEGRAKKFRSVDKFLKELKE